MGSSADPRRRIRDRPSDADVLAAVTELSTRDIAPSTSQVTRYLAGDQPVSGPLHAAVHDVLRHLEAAGRVSRATDQGTHRWSAHRSISASQPAARVSRPSRRTWSWELAVAVALAYVVVALVCFAAGYLAGRLFL